MAWRLAIPVATTLALVVTLTGIMAGRPSLVGALAASPIQAAATLSPGIQITLTAYAFSPVEVAIPAETATVITLLNADTRPLNLTIVDLRVAIDLSPGETRQLTVRAPAGHYELFDSIPGHREAGMRGLLTVVAQPRPASGMPAAITFSSTVTGLVMALPPDPVRLRLERLTIAGGAPAAPEVAAGPELLTVARGVAVVIDDLGVEHRFTANQGVMVPMGATYGIRTGTDAPVELFRLRVVPDAGPPTAEAAVSNVFFDRPLATTPRLPAFLVLADTTWAPGATLPAHEFLEPVGIAVEHGALAVTGRFGLTGKLRPGMGILIPRGMANQERNDGPKAARALLAGLLPPGGALLASPLTPLGTGTGANVDHPVGVAAWRAVKSRGRFARTSPAVPRPGARALT